MAVAIIRQLTLAQVQAAIDAGSTSWNNNYAGTQVYVTDKDWHLACYLDRIAKPLSGILKITNGYTLPNWLTPEILQIDTGDFTDNLSEGSKAITVPAGYYFLYAEMATQNTISEIVYLEDNEATFIAAHANPQGSANYMNMFYPGNAAIGQLGISFAKTSDLLITSVSTDVGTKKVIATFKKSYL